MRVRRGCLGRCVLVLSLVAYQILNGGWEVQQLRALGALRVYGAAVTLLGFVGLMPFLISGKGNLIVLSIGEWAFVIILVLLGAQSLISGVILGNPFSYIMSDAARPIMTAILFVLTLTLCRTRKREYRILARKCATWLLAADMFRLGLYGFDILARHRFVRHNSGMLMAPWWLATTLVESPTVGALVFLLLEIVLHVVSGQRTSTLGLGLMIVLIMASGPRRVRALTAPIIICSICLMLVAGPVQSFFVPRMEAMWLAMRARDFVALNHVSGGRLSEILGGWQTIQDGLPMSLLAGGGGGAEILMDLTGRQKHQIHNTYMALCVRFGVVPTVILVATILYLLGQCTCSHSDAQLCSTMRIYLVVLMITYNAFYGLIGEAEFAIALGLYRAMSQSTNQQTLGHSSNMQ